MHGLKYSNDSDLRFAAPSIALQNHMKNTIMHRLGFSILYRIEPANSTTNVITCVRRNSMSFGLKWILFMLLCELDTNRRYPYIVIGGGMGHRKRCRYRIVISDVFDHI